MFLCYVDTKAGEVYCEFHAPHTTEPEAAHLEADVPQNCSVCGRPLQTSLTRDGIQYVVGYALDALDAWEDQLVLRDREGDYYTGTPQFSVVKDWIEDILNSYVGLARKDEFILRRFIERTKENEASQAT